MRQTFSESGLTVYHNALQILSNAPGKAAQAAKENAFIYARLADRFAKIMQDYGDTAYTAETYAQQHPIIIGQNKTAGVYGQPMREENKAFVKDENGNIDWGYIIKELTFEDNTRMPAAPIRLQIGFQYGIENGAGYAHLKSRHDANMKDKGYSGIEATIADVLENAQYIIHETDRNGKDRLILLKEINKGGVQLILDYNSEGYYTIITATPIREKKIRKLKKEALLNERRVDSSAATGSGAFYTSRATKAGSPDDSAPNGLSNTSNTYSLSEAKEKYKEFWFNSKFSGQMYLKRLRNSELKLACYEVNHRSKAFKRVESSCLALSCLNHGIDPFADCIGDAAVKVCKYFIPVIA